MPNTKANLPVKTYAKRTFNKISAGYERLPVHWILAILVALHSYIVLKLSLPAFYALIKSPDIHWLDAQNIRNFLNSNLLDVTPLVMLGAGLGLSAIGLGLRARTAWFMALFLLMGNLIYSALSRQSSVNLEGYTIVLILLLVL